LLAFLHFRQQSAVSMFFLLYSMLTPPNGRAAVDIKYELFSAREGVNASAVVPTCFSIFNISKSTIFRNYSMNVHKLVAANGGTVSHASGTKKHQGGEPGQAINTSVVLVDRYKQGLLPDGYRVAVTADQTCAVHVAHKTPRGFIVVLTPLNTDVALAAGSFDYTVFA
jgi:hypothetical protein